MSINIDTIFDRWISGTSTYRNNEYFQSSSTILSSRNLHPLACKLGDWILVNGDRCCRGGPPGHIHYNSRLQYRLNKSHINFVTIPFSALSGPLDTMSFDILGLSIVDSQKDSWVMDPISGKETHQIGGSLLKYKDMYLLSTIDHSQRSWSYSLIELCEPVNSLHEAFLSLVPTPIKDVIGLDLKTRVETFRAIKVEKHPWCYLCKRDQSHYKDFPGHVRLLLNHCVYNNGVIRQGEWFFLPISEEPPGVVKKDYYLVNKVGRNNHILTHGKIDSSGNIFAKGVVRHRNKEHFPVYLKNWFQVFENNSKRSWSASGSID